MLLSAALRKILENPEDLSELPVLVSNAEQLEAGEATYQEKIQKLQDINRSYLAQIPIPGDEPEVPEADDEPTLDDAKNQIIELLGGK